MTSKVRKLVCAAFLVPGALPWIGRPFLEAARCCAGKYKQRRFLGGLLPRPWISPRCEFRCLGTVRFGKDVFLDDLCVVYSDDPTTRLDVGSRVSVYRGTVIHLGNGASLTIGDDTHIQNGGQITAFGNVRIGSRVQIAPHCNFYPYDHEIVDDGTPIKDQPLRTKGGIVIGDDAWLGVGVTVLDGVTIGEGAVIGAGAVVTRDVPAKCIAAGIPARVVGTRPKGA